MAYTNKNTALKNIGKYSLESPHFDNFRDNKEVVLAALEVSGDSLQYASDKLKDDKEFVLELIEKKGAYNLKYTSERLKDDREVVMEAIKQDVISLLYASDRLQDDAGVVLEAVKEDGRIIILASNRLKALCEGKDPVIAIETEIKRIEAEKLEKELANKEPIKTKKLKI